MSFLRFAYNNVARNKRAYSAYLFSSSFAVMIFFMYAVFLFHPDVTNSVLGKDTQAGMKAAEYIIFVFSFLFVLFSVSAFLKSRKKEFGMLTILGATPAQINRLIFLENMLIGFAAIVIGLVTGLVVSKIFLIVGANIIEMKALPFYFPLKAIGLTTASFFALFLFISLLTLLFVRYSQVVELMQGANKPKKEPKAAWYMAVLCILALSGALILSKDIEKYFMYVVIFGLAATYLMYTQLSVYVIRLVKKSKRMYRRGTNMILISELAYKVKDNALIFFLVTIVTAMACSAVSFVIIIQNVNKEQLNKSFQLHYRADSKSPFLQKNIRLIDQEFMKNKVKPKKYQLVIKDIKSKELSFISVIKQSDFNAVAKLVGMEPVSLSGKRAALIINPQNKQNEKQSHITLKDQRYPIVKQTTGEIAQFMYDTLVISDSEFAQVKTENISIDNLYYVKAWKEHTPTSESIDTKIGMKIADVFSKQNGSLLGSPAMYYVQLKSASNLMLFVGLFIALVFSISMASFIYFKLYTDLSDDKKQYHAISKIGLGLKEMKKVVTAQIGILFFVPFFFATLQTFWVIKAIIKIRDFDTVTPTIFSICAFFLVQLICFLVVRRRYWSEMQEAMV